MGSEQHTTFTLVVRNTFLELVPEKATSGGRRRSLGDSAGAHSPLSPGASTADDAASRSRFSCSSSGSESDQSRRLRMHSSFQSPRRHSISAESAESSLTGDVGSPLLSEESEETRDCGGDVRRTQPSWEQDIESHFPTAPCSPASPQGLVCFSTSPKSRRSSKRVSPNEGAAMANIQQGPEDAKETRTTVMVRNLPTTMDRNAFMDLLHNEGFRGCYNFIYMPIDFSTGIALSYSFVNFLTPALALGGFRHFQGFALSSSRAGAVELECAWSDPCQGLQQHIQRYRSSPVMHPSIPDEWKPILVSAGHRVPFPAPTRRIKAPKHTKARAPKTAPVMEEGQLPIGSFRFEVVAAQSKPGPR